MNIQTAFDRLNSLLPLKARQERLPVALKALHQTILPILVLQGRVPEKEELQSQVDIADIDKALLRLGAEDLVVLDAVDHTLLGAYPVTLEETTHEISVNSNTIHAMCALDAVSVAPMFDANVVIESRCHVSHSPINLRMQGDSLVQTEPSDDVMIGICWQKPSAVAAHSLCMEMIFLKDGETAAQWKNTDKVKRDVFALPEAVALGKEFFLPLLK